MVIVGNGGDRGDGLGGVVSRLGWMERFASRRRSCSSFLLTLLPSFILLSRWCGVCYCVFCGEGRGPDSWLARETMTRCGCDPRDPPPAQPHHDDEENSTHTTNDEIVSRKTPETIRCPKILFYDLSSCAIHPFRKPHDPTNPL